MLKTTLLLSAAFLSVCANAQSATADQRPLVRLEASAVREIPEDLATANLFTEKENVSPAAAQEEVSLAVGKALAVAKSQDIRVLGSHYAGYPVTGKDGKIATWRVRADVTLESADTAALGTVINKVSGNLTIGNVQYTVSRAKAEQVRQELQDEALRAFKTKASAAAQSLGYSRYELGEIQIMATNEGGRPTPMMAMAVKAAAMPLEQGKSTLGISVSGTIRLIP